MDDSDVRILENFVDAAGRLLGIPAQHKKRLSVLRWLVEDFEPGRRYPEPEVTRSSQDDTGISPPSAGISWTRS